VSSPVFIFRRPANRRKRKPFNLHAFLTSVERAVMRIAVTVIFLDWIIRHLIQEIWR
jgi:hypothetical protein